ncbi:TetR/AcrR family transcriptional regulator [Alsobacter sp. SYSU M60028]|uniref:TetR/AcrR family transcriptional regulator n=1 Tax=Alsobacter ponti TaxID=2962936 RepID=A0ABT1LEH9_9HYPH|nr:TetR/AcrR family transcriptional regulator [Alsobacter ponti]MCP8939308.1 TetR/AcrR family transcriptional regulator [Alsobacter ponti]
MSEQPRGRSSSRERILDAAAQLVCEVGAGRLTLDAVAERSGLSKGGLLYSFPTKEALLRGMVERMVGEALSEKARLQSALAHRPNAAARVAIAICQSMRCKHSPDVATGLLAASAENPTLLDPIREAIVAGWGEVKETSENRRASMIAWLANEGLRALDMHGISPLTPEDREECASALEQLLDNGIAGPKAG